MRLSAILAALDATETEHLDYGPGRQCVKCGRAVRGYADRRPTLCRPCTYAELDTGEYDLSLQIEFGLSRKVYMARLDKYGYPFQTPKEWLTPKSRLRH